MVDVTLKLLTVYRAVEAFIIENAVLRSDGGNDSSCLHIDTLEVYRYVLITVAERMSIDWSDREHDFVQVYDQDSCVQLALQLSLHFE